MCKRVCVNVYLCMPSSCFVCMYTLCKSSHSLSPYCHPHLIPEIHRRGNSIRPVPVGNGGFTGHIHFLYNSVHHQDVYIRISTYMGVGGGLRVICVEDKRGDA